MFSGTCCQWLGPVDQRGSCLRWTYIHEVNPARLDEHCFQQPQFFLSYHLGYNCEQKNTYKENGRSLDIIEGPEELDGWEGGKRGIFPLDFGRTRSLKITSDAGYFVPSVLVHFYEYSNETLRYRDILYFILKHLT